MDSRFPTYYLNDRRILRLPPTAFRLYVVATAWSVSNMTDGLLETEDRPLIPFWSDDDMAHLVKAGLWKIAKDGHQIADFLKTQTSAAQLEAALLNRRKADAERQRKRREKLNAEEFAERFDTDQTSRDRHVTSEGKAEEEAEAEDQAEASMTKDLKQSFSNVADQDSFDANTGELFDPDHCKGCGSRLTAYLKSQGNSCFDCLPLAKESA